MSTIKPDKMYCVLVQADNGEISAVGGPFGDTLHVIHDASRPAVIDILGSLIPPNGTYDDTLKLAHLKGGVTVNVGGDIVGGMEDVIDATICENVYVNVAGVMRPTGKFVSTIKGQTNGFTLSGRIEGHGTETDIDIGNNYDAGGVKLNGKTRNVKLNLTCSEPIKVRPLSADDPIILNPTKQRYCVDKWTRIFWPLYLLFH